MTGTLIVGILAALVAFALMRFAAKQPWAVAIIAAVVVLVSINIDWSKPVADIDQQLYKKYGLTPDEIKFIETHVKEME